MHDMIGKHFKSDPVPVYRCARDQGRRADYATSAAAASALASRL